MVRFHTVDVSELNNQFLASFNRYQKVTYCWRYIDKEWVLKELSFVEEWDTVDKLELIDQLKETLHQEGMVLGAFEGDRLIGFSSVEGAFFGSEGQYLQLSTLHITVEYRREGIGRQLFNKSAQWACLKGAKKLYISAHSSQETIAFYQAMGCQAAMEVNEELTRLEPFDCQLEYPLSSENH